MRSISEKLDEWQSKSSFRAAIPEIVIAVSIGVIAATGWQAVFDFGFYWAVGVFIVSAVVAYAGKQSATWAYLNWEGHTKDNNGDGVINEKDGRDSTMRGVNDWLAARLGYRLGDEGYSWVWAFTKGLITTLPLGGTGAIFQPLWREVASHAKGRLPFEHNFWMEFVGDGFAYASAAGVFIIIVF